jgi:hypothetical protein
MMHSKRRGQVKRSHARTVLVYILTKEESC